MLRTFDYGLQFSVVTVAVLDACIIFLNVLQFF